MADKTGIEWTDATWNPITGCTEVSPGCDHCYAKTFAERWRGTPGHYFEHGFDIQLRPERMDQPIHWRKPRRIFVNSMSDLFHDQVPDDYIAHVFAVMQSCAAHTFQILTKRHARMRSLLSSDEFWSTVTDFGHIVMAQRPARQQNWPYHGQKYGYLPNVWLGVSTETQQWADIRIPTLLATPAAVRFISAEPLLGQIDLTSWLNGGFGTVAPADIDWVIVGGESGHGAKPMHPKWARELRDVCLAADVPFLFKQWGEWTPSTVIGGVRRLVYLSGDTAEVGNSYATGAVLRPGSQLMYRVGKRHAGRELDGRTWDQYPQEATA
jgi:protein gp37